MSLAGTIVARLNTGNSVAVHCRAGIGRSSLIAACGLVLLGFAPGIRPHRQGAGIKVPDTEEQRNWVEKFRETMTTGGIIPPETRT
jgi:hypothetical protein